MNRLVLKDKIFKFLDIGTINSDLLYQEIIYAENNSEINKEDFEKLLIMIKYINETYSGENDRSYDDYKKFYEMVKREYPDMYYGDIIEPAKGELWKGIYNPSLGFKEKNQIGKIYLSIDKKDLANFACSLLSNIVKNRIDDFNFKINNGEQWNRSDNLVIYLYSTEDLNKYLSIIKDILKNNSQTQINESHLFGNELQNGVVVALGKDNGNISFSGDICKYICNLITKGMEIDDIVDSVEKRIEINDLGNNNIKPNDISNVTKSTIKSSPGKLSSRVNGLRNVFSRVFNQRDKDK